jgi:hypothetical protein
MKKYKSVEVSERELEDLIRRAPELIEEGLRYIEHQRMTDRGPLDVLMVDSGGALVVAELKVGEDDTMLVQGIDYYDYVSRNVEAISRMYGKFEPDPTQDVRLFLIAPGFSTTLMNRCKWIDIPISLFQFKCIRFEDSQEVTPIFYEVTLPTISKPEERYQLKDRIDYVTEPEAKARLKALLDEIQGWDKENVLIQPTKYDVSLKVHGSVFSYIGPRRRFFVVYTNDDEGKWTGFPVKEEQDLEPIKEQVKANMQRLRKG